MSDEMIELRRRLNNDAMRCQKKATRLPVRG